MTALEDDPTLEEYIRMLSDGDKALLTDIPLNDIEAIIDMDSDQFAELIQSTPKELNEELQIRRFQLITEISKLQIDAMHDREYKKYYNNKSKSKSKSNRKASNKSDPTKEERQQEKPKEFTIYKYSKSGSVIHIEINTRFNLMHEREWTGETVSNICKRYGTSRKTYYK